MQILRMPAVKAETGHRSNASIYNAIRAGTFTQPVQIGQRSVGWPSDEVDAINAARIAGKTDAEIRELVKVLHAKRTELAAAADMLEADAQPAVPQEPVAWYEYNADLDAWFLAYGHNPKAKTRPLIFGDAAPQPKSQRPRLTDEEIDSVPFNGFTDLRQRFESENECLRAFARAIERKVRGER